MNTYFAALTLPILGCVSATLLAQSVTITPTVSPSAIPVATPSVLTVSALITTPPSTPLISNSVNLLQVDQFGNALSVVGNLNDSGVNGDLIAGDGIFGGKYALTDASTGVIYLRISAAFRGQLRRSLSSLLTVQVVSASVPTTLNPFNINTVVTDPVSNTQVVCNELLTSFIPGTPLNTITATAASVGGTIAGWLPALDVYQIGFSNCDVANLNAAISVLQSQSIVTTAQKNGIVQLDTVTPFQPNDPLFQQQWNLSQIQAPYAWSLTQTGATIGIIDTGIDFNHEDLGGNVVAGLDQCASVDSNGNCLYGSGSLPMDTFGHGTGTASVAGAITNNGKGMSGAAFDVKLIAEKVGVALNNGKFYGTCGAAALGIVDAVNFGARVINLSFGCEYPIDLAVQYAYTKNRVVVAAAGNSNDSVPFTPAAYPNVISVGASDENNSRADWVQECPDAKSSQPASNYGTWVNIYAPGTNIVHANRNGGYQTDCQAGTSWAAPQVSATASLMLSVNPSLTPDQVKLIIMSSALNTGHTDITGGNPIYLLNMFNAVQTAKNQSVAGVGAVVLSATLDGKVWGGSVTVAMNSISLTPTVPITLSNQQPGSYNLKYSSGGPPNSALVGVMPCGSGTSSCTEALSAGEVLTFVLQFKSSGPTAGFTMAASGQSEHNGQTLNLTVAPGGTANVSFDGTALSTSANGATISRYQWTLDESSLGSNFGSFSQALAVGTHTVSLVVTDSRGVMSVPATGTVAITVAMTWAHTWGGSVSDSISSVATDTSGNTYAAGSTSSFGAGNGDILLLKYDSVGNLVWQRTWGGSARDYGNGVAVDPSGNVYVAGGTLSFGAGSYDAVILKFDSSGNLIWQRTWGGGGFDIAYDIAFDVSGDLYVAAESYSLGERAVLLKIAANGNYLGAYTWKGSATYDSGYSVDVDGSGNVILSGTSWDYSVYPNHNSILLVKFDGQGNFLWHRNIVSGAEDEAIGFKTVRFDAGGNILVAGHRAAVCATVYFSSCNFDVEVFKLDPDGNSLWATTWGSPAFESAGGLAFDLSGNLIVGGTTSGLLDGVSAALLLQFDPNGNLLLSQTWGTDGSVSGAGVSVNASGELSFGGTAQNANSSWQNVTGSWNSLPLTITGPVGNVGTATFALGSPSGTVTQPVGVKDVGGGGPNALIIRIPVP